MKIKISIKKGEDGYYVVTVPSLPGCVSQGKTIAEAKKNIKEAIELYLETMLEDGVPIVKKDAVKEYEVQVKL